ncbi:MAG: GAF domain-containing protein [Methylocystaceae bacterium]|nr:GAF domain-containing protein [Methylocystaceae bacterium]
MSKETDVQSQLHNITQANCANDEKIIRILQLGCEYFGLMFGLVSKIEEESYFIIHAYPDGIFSVGARFDLQETICDITNKDHDIVAFSKASGTDWVTHPAYEKFSIESYIGMPYLLSDGTRGTLNFSSPTALPNDFTDQNKKILRELCHCITKILTIQ